MLNTRNMTREEYERASVIMRLKGIQVPTPNVMSEPVGWVHVPPIGHIDELWLAKDYVVVRRDAVQDVRDHYASGDAGPYEPATFDELERALNQ